MDQQPRKISNFHLSRCLHSGSRADVHQGRFAQAGGVVQLAAIKVLQPRFACIGHELRAFLTEAGWATELRSPLFPRVFEAGEHKGNYFIAMEYIDGWTLTKVLASLAALQVPLPCEVGLSIAEELATGLHKMHELREHDALMGVVHLGINPDNIMLSKEGQARVLDFGMTIATVDRELTESDSKAKDFQSPERLRGLPVDRRADIFALGRVLQHMVDCMVPDVVRDDLPALLARSCHADPEQRFATMEDFQVALKLVAKNRALRPSRKACEKFTLEIFGHKVAKVDPRSRRPQPAVPLRMSSEGQKTSYEPVTPPAEALRELDDAMDRLEHGGGMDAKATAFGSDMDAKATAFGSEMDAKATAVGGEPEANVGAFGEAMDAMSTAFGEAMFSRESAPAAGMDAKATAFGAPSDEEPTAVGEVMDPKATLVPGESDAGITAVGDVAAGMATVPGGAPGDPDTVVGSETDERRFVDEHMAVTKPGVDPVPPNPDDSSDASQEVTAFSVTAAKEKQEKGGFREELIPTKPYANHNVDD